MIQILTVREIGEQRRAKKISQARFAEMLGISRSQAQYMEQEDGDPRLSIVIKATELLLDAVSPTCGDSGQKKR